MSRPPSTPLPRTPIRAADTPPEAALDSPFSSKAENVFDYAQSVFERTASTTALSVSFQLAGRIVRLKFANEPLRFALTPAFAHLDPAGDQSADLTVFCWDDASSGEILREPEGGAGRSGVEFVDGPVRIAWEPEQRHFSAFSIAKRLALFRVADAATLPSWERAAPLRRILHWWASDQGLQLVHAAALGDRDGGVLLVGPGGSGKSTTALACIGSSIGYAGDDYCLISMEGSPRAHALYGSGKADAASVARLPNLKEAFAASTLQGEGKSVIFVDQAAIVGSFALRAIVAPQVAADTDGRLDQLSKAEALRAVAPTTLFQMPGDRRESLSRLTALIRDLPCWRLTVGRNPEAAQVLLKSLFATGRLPA
jgi:hypothetical protein